MSITSDQLVLHKLSSYYSKRWEKIISFFILLLLIIFVVVLINISPEQLSQWTADIWQRWLSHFWEKSKDDPMFLFHLVSSLLSVLGLVYLYLSHQRERILLTPFGIHYQSALPSFLQWMKPDWFMRWSQIKTAYFKPAILQIKPGPLSMTLVLETTSFQRKIVPCFWFELNDLEEIRSSLLKWYSLAPPQMKYILPHCPIIKYLTQMGIEINMEPVEKELKTQQNFTLESNPSSLTAVILFFVFLGYAILDIFINQENYVDTPFYNVYIGSGILMAVFTMIWLIRAKVPKLESIIVALLLGGSFGWALYPGLLRINQLTDTKGLQTYQYVLQKDSSLQAKDDSTLPRLYFQRDLDYWLHFERGTIHEIELRKGGLDFYQINMAPIYADMRKYFRQQN